MFRGAIQRKKKATQKRDEKVIPVQRVHAVIKRDSGGDLIEGRVVLNDLTHGGVGCFIDTPIYRGEIVSLVIEQPKHLFVKGKVLGCFPYVQDTKVLHSEQFRYRAVIKFEFDSPEEQLALQKYCDELYVRKT